MSKIEELISKYCPNGVEYSTVEQLCKVSRGHVMSKDYLAQNIGDYPVYSSQTVNDGMLGQINTYDYDGEYLTWTTDGANAGSVFFRSGKFSITNVCGLLDKKSDDINIKFMYYYLAYVAKGYVNEGMGNPKLMSNVMQKIKIPIPPLSVQQEIVRILDGFSELEKELEKELVARRKQYEYYRNQLVSFGEGGNHACDVKIGTVKDIVSDSFWIMPPTPKYITVGIPYITSKNIGEGKISFDNIKYISHEDFENISAKRPISPGDILISMIGTLGNTAIVSEEYGDFYGQNMFLLRLNPSVMLVKYFMYFFNSVKIKNYLNAIKNNSGQGYLKTQHIENLEIPIPPLAEQERIVAILDKFDALVNDISVGLPAELKARRKQYEYWRNKLLSFEEVA